MQNYQVQRNARNAVMMAYIANLAQAIQKQQQLNMSVGANPDTGAIEEIVQKTHEKYSPQVEQEIDQLPMPRAKKKEVKKGFELTDKVNDGYKIYLNSDEGQEFARFFGYRPEFDQVAKVDLPKEVGAATMPEGIEKTLIVSDYSDKNAAKIALQIGVDKQDMWNMFYAHEKYHHVQGKAIRAKGRLFTEMDTDRAMTLFYEHMMQKAQNDGNADAVQKYAKLADYNRMRWNKLGNAYIAQLQKARYQLSPEMLEQILPNKEKSPTYSIGATEAVAAYVIAAILAKRALTKGKAR